MVNKDKTGSYRQSRLRASRVKWLAENAYGLSVEGLIGALMRGECSLSWSSVPTSRALDGAKWGGHYETCPANNGGTCTCGY